MANPPIVIGPFDNVPAPGSPIRSDWPQEISAYVINPPSQYECILAHSVAQSIPNTTITALTFDTEVSDIGNMHNPANPTRITCPVAGVYAVMFNCAVQVNATGVRTAFVRANGVSSDRRGIANDYGAGTWDTTLAGSFVARLAAGAYLEVLVQQTSGIALNVLGNNTAGFINQFSAVRLAA